MPGTSCAWQHAKFSVSCWTLALQHAMSEPVRYQNFSQVNHNDCWKADQAQTEFETNTPKIVENRLQNKWWPC
eukprot:6486070-Amphidinium_carterae.1